MRWIRRSHQRSDAACMRNEAIGGVTVWRSMIVPVLCGIALGWVLPTAAQNQNTSPNELGGPASPGTTKAATLSVTTERINQLRSEVEAAESLDEAAKTATKQSLDQAALDLQSTKESMAETARMQQAIEHVPSTRETIREQLDTAAATAPAVDLDQSLAGLQQQLVALQSQLAEAEKSLTDAATQSSRRQARSLAIPAEQSALNERLETVRRQLTVPATSELTSQAARLSLQAAEMELVAALAKLATEQAYYVATTDLLPLQRQLAEQRVARLRRNVEQLNAAINHYQQDEITQWRGEIRDLLETAPDTLSEQVQETLEYIRQYETISSRMISVTRQLQEVRQQLEEVQTREQTMTDRVGAVGLTEALALLLQAEKTRLQTLRRQYQPNRQVKSEIQDLQILTFRLEDKANELAASDLAEITAEIPTADTHSQQQEPIVKLAGLRRQVLQKAAPAGAGLFQQLVALDTAQRRLREAIDDYLVFIEEKLLWTRSIPSITATDPRHSIRGLVWLLSLEHWATVPAEWIRTLKTKPFPMVLLLLLLVGLWSTTAYWQRAINEETQQASKRNCVDLRPTLRVAGATCLITAPLPVTLWGLGWMVADSNEGLDFASSVGHGFYAAAIFLAPVILLRQICRTDGLGAGHFGWPESICGKIRNACDTMVTLAAPLGLGAAILRSQSDEAIANSLGRYLILAFLIVIAVIVHRLLLPHRYWAGHRDGYEMWYRLRRLIYAIALLIPILLAFLVASGFSYVFQAVTVRLLSTSIILLVVMLVESVALRATLLRYRKLSIQQLQRQRQQLSEKSPDLDAAAAAVGMDTTEREFNLSEARQQARQLIRLVAMVVAIVLVWMVWRDLLPALVMLDRFELWTVGEGVNLTLVTLSDLLLAVIVIGITIVAVINLPAVMELVLLRRLTMNPGGRYAVSTIFQYVVGTVGIVIGLSFLSIPWSQLSWIVAAASVGLGFGLQEILANFVSGIILLLEQPIRVGDIVTIDGTTGVVTKMQIRATTVTNWDRQELVVPNKDLITGKLLNWTLSSVINRVVINVGVAYGTDIRRAHELILAASASHPEVLQDPAPNVTLEEFGESALRFVVRLYLPTLEKRLKTIHEINVAIACALNEAGIVIPFPQRDVHLTLTKDSATLDEWKAK